MKIDRIELVAYILIGIGAVLLILTFYMAFSLLVTGSGILPAPNLSEALGKILGPIVEAVIKIMYLGIMGWTASIATIRGIQLIKEAKQPQQPKTPPTPPTQQPPPEKEEKTKP